MNTKRFIIIALTALILAGCASDKPQNGDHGTSGSDISAVTTVAESNMAPVTTDDEKTTETIAVLPPLPEEIPDIPDAEIKFTNDFLIVQVDPEGTTYANGKPVVSSEVAPMIQQAMTNQINKTKETSETVTKTPDVPEMVVTEPDITVPDVTRPEETERPTGTIFIDDTEDKDDGDNNGYEDAFSLAKYVDTGDTDLNITDIAVYNSAKPGVAGVDKFNPGETMLVNLWCNSIARMDSTVYIIPEEADHADSYAPEDCLLSQEMFTAFETAEGQIFFEIELPDSIIPGVYELRFVCGSEEGYIPFHLG